MRDRNYQEDFNQNRSQRRKKTTGVIALGLAGVLVLGSLFAFFSDRLENNKGQVTAGTLDLESTIGNDSGFAIKVWKDGSGSNPTIDNKIQNDELSDYNDISDPKTDLPMVLNPGDKLVIVGGVENRGSKSAWLRSELNLTIKPYDKPIAVGMDELGIETDTHIPEIREVLSYLKFSKVDQEGDLTEYGEINFNVDTTLNTAQLNLIEENIIDGDIEEESPDPEKPNLNILGSKQYSSKMLVIEFLSESIAGTSINYAQGHTIEMDASWKALQYRNNDAPNWETVKEIVTLDPTTTP